MRLVLHSHHHHAWGVIWLATCISLAFPSWNLEHRPVAVVACIAHASMATVPPSPQHPAGRHIVWSKALMAHAAPHLKGPDPPRVAMFTVMPFRSHPAACAAILSSR
jgi:hypothetical protein